HLRDNNAAATMEAPPPDTQAFPLNEPGGMPFNTGTNSAQKISNLAGIISFLKVDDAAHLRYKPDGNTFCNIYAYDLAYLAGRQINKYFIPRVWWTDGAIAKILAGQPQIPALDVTVREMTANDLHDWFAKFGGNFGWGLQNDLTVLQNAVNT